MTPHELNSAIVEFVRQIGPKADMMVSFGINSDHLTGSIYPQGIGNSLPIRVSLPDACRFEDIIPAFEAAWLEHGAAHRQEMIHKMAMKIIAITAERGDCPDYALRMTFADEDVQTFGEEAEAEANVIAGKGPFSISRHGAGNGAPAIEEAA